MNSDIRLSLGFYRNPKTKKLIKRLGLEGIVALQLLWIWCAENRPDGDLSGLDDEDIELAADWNGEESALVETLADLRWIDKTETGYVLHGWAERNPWAAEADNRSDKARLSKLAQVNPDAYHEFIDAGRTGISREEYQRAANGALPERRNCDATATTATAERRNSDATATATATTATAERPIAKRSAPSPSPSPSPDPKAAAALGSREDQIARAREGAADAAAAAAAKPKPAPKPKPKPPPAAKPEAPPASPPALALVPASPPAVSEAAPDAERMPLARAAELYRACFAGKSNVQVAPMALAKLDALVARYSRAEMEAAFDAAATAGASSLAYLEKTLEGKRADAAQGVDPASRDREKPRSKRAESLKALGYWAQGDWLREEIATGMARLLADGERSGAPAADTITLTARGYEEELRKYQMTEDERPRVRTAFEQARLHVSGWPRTREICEHLPPRERARQEALPSPEETQERVHLPFTEGLMRIREAARRARASPDGEETETDVETATEITTAEG